MATRAYTPSALTKMGERLEAAGATLRGVAEALAEKKLKSMTLDGRERVAKALDIVELFAADAQYAVDRSSRLRRIGRLG